MLRTGRSPVYLVIVSMTGQSGATEEESSFLHSDVQTFVEVTISGVTTRVPTVFDDSGSVTFRVDTKNAAVDATGLNAVTLTRYRVNFRRSDGRNTPGVDVPYGFDGGMSGTVDPGATSTFGFQLVRHQSKLEPPLRNMIGFGGQGFISTIAEITFFGRDQNGNEVTVTGNLDVQFGDFGDE